MTDFLKLVEERGLICPQPQPWNQLWEMLPNKTRKGSAWEPPLPLILDGWWYSNNGQKKERFQAHLQWADSNGITDEVIEFLETLSPEDWHKKGD